MLCELIFAVCAHANPWRLAVGPRSWPFEHRHERRRLALGPDGTWVGATPDMDICEERPKDTCDKERTDHGKVVRTVPAVNPQPTLPKTVHATVTPDAS